MKTINHISESFLLISLSVVIAMSVTCLENYAKRLTPPASCYCLASTHSNGDFPFCHLPESGRLGVGRGSKPKLDDRSPFVPLEENPHESSE